MIYECIIHCGTNDFRDRKLICTLWGQFAEQIRNYLAKENEGPAILINQWCKIKDYAGKY